MLTRKPTRLEMKSDDLHEYTEVKEERLAAKRAAAAAAAASTAGASSSTASMLTDDAPGRQQLSKAERIGLVRK